jgi:hypothetical protein
MKTRPNGFYWVKFQSKWIVAEWYEHSSWFLCGDPAIYSDKDFEEIGELIFN